MTQVANPLFSSPMFPFVHCFWRDKKKKRKINCVLQGKETFSRSSKQKDSDGHCRDLMLNLFPLFLFREDVL